MDTLKKFVLVTIYHFCLLLLCLFILSRGYLLFAGRRLQLDWAETFLMLLFFGIYLVLMWRDLYSKSYSHYFRYTIIIVARNIAGAVLCTLVVALMLVFVYPEAVVSRTAMSVFLLTSTGVFILLHMIHFAWIMNLSHLGLFHKRVLYLGKPDDRFPLDAMFQDAGGTKELCGRCVHRDNAWSFMGADKKHSRYEKLEALFFRNQVSEAIIFLGKDMEGPVVAQVTDFCRENAISYYLVPDIKSLPRLSRWSYSLSYVPLIERFATNRDSLVQISAKRILDIVFSSLVLLCFSPFWLAIVLAIKLEDGGPALYVSSRVGKNGKPIKFLKFRSMVLNADQLKAELLARNERKDGPLFKMKNDPRVTKVGRFLRRYSLDEMPQFANVLKGDMSVVGPRPHLPSEVASYVNEDYLRLECIPGITCLPQVHDRNNLSFRQWVDLDIKYRKEWNVFMDFKLIYQTALVVLKPLVGKGEVGY
jgi:exopolysaccharide biosynthesis polyprenyl glycosylphosphotransferase